MFTRRFDRSRLVTVGAAAAALLLAGCTTTASPGGDDKAGGSVDPVVLRLANTSFGLDRHPALQYFVDRVKEVSGGALRIDVAQGWGNNAADAEQQVVRDVKAGTIDLGSVGTHVFDTVGVTGFQALTAPMLIDNYPLLQAVLDSDIPAEMLAGLDTIGVDGIAVLADGLRKPIAVAHPLLGPTDYQGITFEAFRSQDHADAIKALGATPIDTLPDAALSAGDIDGFEKGLRIYDINGKSYLAPYVTANVNLWPHALALIANPDTMASLTTTQLRWLTQAGADAASRSTDLTDDDAALVVKLCEGGARFANASDTDLQAMRHAFAPIFSTLDRDPTTKDFIERIDKLKQSTAQGPALEIPAGCTGPAAASPGATPAPTAVTAVSVDTALDGTYRWTITKDDALAHGTPNDKTPESLATFPWVFTMTMKDGTTHLKNRAGDGDSDIGRGFYAVNGDRITFTWQNGAPTQAFTYSVDDDATLHLVAVLPMDPGDQFVTVTEPWQRIADASGNTVPTSLGGTYRWTITKDDALAHGTPNDKTPEILASWPSTMTITMTDGTWKLTSRGGGVVQESGRGSYTIDGDRVVFDWGSNPPLTFVFSVDADGTVHLDPQAPMAAGDQFIWATEPWEKIG